MWAIPYVVIITVGILAYFAYTRWMPKEWRAKLAGWKTNVLGAIVGFAPDLLNLLSMFQILSDQWVPTENTQWIMRCIGVAIVVLRWITSFEQKEE